MTSWLGDRKSETKTIFCERAVVFAAIGSE